MIPTFVISLPDSGDRSGTLLRALRDVGLDPVLHFGIDGRAGLPPECETRINRAAARENMFRDMLDSEFACALSHLQVYETIVQSGLDRALIFEDDALIQDDFANCLPALKTVDADLVTLMHAATYVRKTKPVGLPSGHRLHRLTQSPFYACAYLLSRRGAEYIQRHALPIARPADWPCDITRIESYAMDPQPVHHPAEPEKSNIGEAGRRDFRGRAARFLTAAYWRRFWLKRTSRKIA